MSAEALLLPLSCLYGEADSRRAAKQVLSAPEPDREIERLYPALLEHNILPAALAHLQRAGGDLERLTISTALFRATWPYNAILPTPEECSPGRISLAAIRRRLEEHRVILRRTLQDVLDAGAEGALMLPWGEAIAATYPAYDQLPRLRRDIDVFVADVQTGLRILGTLWDRLGFVLKKSAVSPVDGGWIAHWILSRISREGHWLRFDLLMGGRPIERDWLPAWYHPPLWERVRRVEWNGRRVLVPSPEDIVLMKAEKVRRRGGFHLRDFGDIRFLLTAGEGQLDWDYLASAALGHRLDTALYVLAREAERQEGRALVPAGVLRRLAPGTVEKYLLTGSARARQSSVSPSRLWRPYWFLQHLGVRLGKPRALVRLLRDRFRVDHYSDLVLDWLKRAGPQALPVDLTAVLPLERARSRWARLMRVRSPFAASITALEQAVARIEEQWAGDRTPQLLRARVRKEFELGLNLLAEVQSLGELSAEASARVAPAQKALDILKRAASRDANDSICWQARAWLGRCYEAMGLLRKARAAYARVIRERGPHAEPGKRLAKYFHLLLLAQNSVSVPNALHRIQRAAEDWLASYPAHRDSPEAYGVRFQLAEAYYGQARSLPPTEVPSARALQLYARAEKHYDELERIESDYADMARERKRAILLARTGEAAGSEVGRLSTFQECYLQAQAEIARMAQGPKPIHREAEPDASKLEAGRRGHLRNIIAALTRALDLADKNTPVADRSEVRYMLAYAYLDFGQPDQAAMLAEELVHAMSGSKRACSAAGLALQAYALIVAREERDACAPAREARRNRMCELAKYVQQTWAEEPVADLARHLLGAIALREKNYAEAVAMLSRVRPDYSLFLLSQLQLAVAEQQAGNHNLHISSARPPCSESKIASSADVTTYLLGPRRAASLPLQRLWYETCFRDYFPELPDHAKPALAEVYLCALLERANVLFTGQHYEELGKVAAQIYELFAIVKPYMPEKAREALQLGLAELPLYARYGQIDAAFRAGRYAEVRRLMAPVVSRLREQSPLPPGNLGLVRSMLGLALRASLEEGDPDWSEEISQLLRKKLGGDGPANASQLCASLIQVLDNAAGVWRSAS